MLVVIKEKAKKELIYPALFRIAPCISISQLLPYILHIFRISSFPAPAHFPRAGKPLHSDYCKKKRHKDGC